MIVHIVMFKLTESAQKKDNIILLKDKLDNMKNKIREIKHLETGINITNSPSAYDLVLTTHFDSVDDLEKYRVHPIHQEVLEYINQVKDDIHVVDYMV